MNTTCVRVVFNVQEDKAAKNANVQVDKPVPVRNLVSIGLSLPIGEIH